MAETKDINMLVVDDDPDVAGAVTQLFEAFGFNVSMAFSGNEAIKALAKRPAQIIITDIRMSDGDGVHLVKFLRSKNYSVPAVLFMSGHSDYSTEELYSVGGDGFFAKPFSAATVREVIRQCLLRLEDRWAKRPTQHVSSSFKARAAGMDSMDPQVGFRFGRRGCFISSRLEFPEVGQLVEFKLDLTNPNPVPVPMLEGVGRVRWVRKVNNVGRPSGFGVEVVWLADHCREKVVRWIESEKPIATIPVA